MRLLVAHPVSARAGGDCQARQWGVCPRSRAGQRENKENYLHWPWRRGRLVAVTTILLANDVRKRLKIHAARSGLRMADAANQLLRRSLRTTTTTTTTNGHSPTKGTLNERTSSQN